METTRKRSSERGNFPGGEGDPSISIKLVNRYAGTCGISLGYLSKRSLSIQRTLPLAFLYSDSYLYKGSEDRSDNVGDHDSLLFVSILASFDIRIPVAMRFLTVASILAAAVPALTCENCYGPKDSAAHVRNVRRQQPSAQNATDGPKGTVNLPANGMEGES